MQVIKMNKGLFAVVPSIGHEMIIYNEYYAPVAIISYNDQKIYMRKKDEYYESEIFSFFETIVYDWTIELVDHRKFTDILDNI